MSARVARAALAIVLCVGCGAHDEAPPPPVSVAPEPPPPPPPPPPTRAGPLCTYHGVCWVRPGPQGNALHALRALAADRVIAVGDRGTVLAWDGHEWSFEDTPTRERLLDLADAPSGELFAVGEHGTILRREGSAWTAMASGAEAPLRAVVAVAADDVIAVGDGVALHYDGVAWTREVLPDPIPADTSLVALARHDATIYALGARVDGDSPSRLVISRDATGWHVLSTVQADVGSLAVLADGTFVLSGASARHGDGATWRERPFGSDRPLDAIASLAADDAWAGGYDGRMAHWDGHAWHAESLDAALDVDDIDGTSATDVWAVGEHGLIAHRDASAWTVVTTGSPARFEGVGGLAHDDVWVVGESASLHFDGHAWSPAGPDDLEIEALGVASDALYAVGSDGAIRRYASGAWASEASGTTTKLEGVWASEGGHAIAVGGSEWTQRDGAAWTALTERPSATGIWGSAANDVWAVGGGGLEHFDGSAWTPASGVEPLPLFGVWGAAANDVWAVGAEGHVLHFDGTRWSPVDSDTQQDLVGVWGAAANDVWAVGRHGTIVHWDGERWRWRDSGTDELLHAVWGAPGEGPWIVGHGGVVLRVERP